MTVWVEVVTGFGVVVVVCVVVVEVVGFGAVVVSFGVVVVVDLSVIAGSQRCDVVVDAVVTFVDVIFAGTVIVVVGA